MLQRLLLGDASAGAAGSHVAVSRETITVARARDATSSQVVVSALDKSAGVTARSLSLIHI